MNVITQQEATLVQRACTKVTGFPALYKRLEKKVIRSSYSKSTLTTGGLQKENPQHVQGELINTRETLRINNLEEKGINPRFIQWYKPA